MNRLPHRPAVVLTGVVLAAVALAGMFTIARLSTEPVAEQQPTGRQAPLSQIPLSQTPAPLSSTVSALPQPDPPMDDPLVAVAGLTQQDCRLPPWSDDPRYVKVFVLVALGCLNTAWEPVLVGLHLEYEPATVEMTGEVDEIECGRPPEQHSFYCDGTIYLAPSSYLDTNAGPMGVPAAAVSMLAHEYGHHLQDLSGTLTESTRRIAMAGSDTPAGQELARRVELQAQCFSGMFMGATFDAPSLEMARQDNYTRGDAPDGPRDHGSAQNFGDWFTKGAAGNSLDECDTWTAPAAAVG